MVFISVKFHKTIVNSNLLWNRRQQIAKAFANSEFGSTGGIIALGLGVENWSVDSCINKFTDLVHHAFAPREFHGVWGFEHLAMARHGSKYRTRPFEKALQDAFADKPLFGGQDLQDGYMIKVAVTSTTYVDQHPVLLTNYNRPEPQNFRK